MIKAKNKQVRIPALHPSLMVQLQAATVKILVVGGGVQAIEQLNKILSNEPEVSLNVIAENPCSELKELALELNFSLEERELELQDIEGAHFLIAATGDPLLNKEIKYQAEQFSTLVQVADDAELSDFNFQFEPGTPLPFVQKSFINKFNDGEVRWRRLATQCIIVFTLMVVGHIIISYLPIPSFEYIWLSVEPHLTTQFFYFVFAGFLAQMVDGVLSMGYGVTSATCLISAGVNPVSVSAAIHTSEIFTTGISGFSHYKFGNVNKKLFKHLVIPGVIGAVLGAIALVYVGEIAGKWLMPIIAFYALFLGVKILLKAFQSNNRSVKVKRVGWLAYFGGFLDSFGGGGWGPIVTSTLISKGRSPKYTVGTVSLTEFFVTMASAFTFFITAGIQHVGIVIGLLIGGSIAAPFAARLAGKLPRKTMMIAVGIMVILWCIRLIIKSFD